MTRKRKKRIVYTEFNSASIKDAKRNSKGFLKALLSQIGLQSGIDYWVTNDFLRIRHLKQVTGKILITLKEIFPVFNFYWETPRILVWF